MKRHRPPSLTDWLLGVLQDRAENTILDFLKRLFGKKKPKKQPWEEW